MCGHTDCAYGVSRVCDMDAHAVVCVCMCESVCGAYSWLAVVCEHDVCECVWGHVYKRPCGV